MDLGAAMPIRTLEPLTSMTSTTTSSPTMIFSPGRRVMMSILGTPPWRRIRGASVPSLFLGGPGRLLLEAGEQRCPDGGVGRLVDHLVAGVAHHQDRRAEVGAEVVECGGWPHGDVHRRVL